MFSRAHRPRPHKRHEAVSRVGWFVAGALPLACAPPANDGLQKDLANLRAELESSRRAQDELRGRVERLEGRVALLGAPRPPAPRAAAPVAPADPLSDLPVVRLEAPRAGAAAAPPLDTRRTLKEPSDSEWAGISSPQAETEDDRNAPAIVIDPAADAAFDAAFAKYRTNDGAAADALTSFAARYPKHDSADNALHLAALVYVRQGRCADAVPLLEKAAAAGSGSDAQGPAMLELGRCEADLGHGDRARTWFEKLVKQRPNTAEAAEAMAALGDLRAAEAVAQPPRP